MSSSPLVVAVSNRARERFSSSPLVVAVSNRARERLRDSMKAQKLMGYFQNRCESWTECGVRC